MKIFGLILLLFSLSVAVSAEERKELKLPDFSEVSADLKKREAAKNPTASCQTATGSMVEAGEPGFEQCMREIQVSPQSHTKVLGVDNQDGGTGTSSSLSFGTNKKD